MSLKDLPIITKPRIVDFSALAIDKSEEQLHREHFDRIAHELRDGFAADGVVYIKNHGIDENEIARAFNTGDSFFDLPADVKLKYRVQWGKDEEIMGYAPIDGERLSYNSKLDGDGSSLKIEDRVEYRETFNVAYSKSQVMPEGEIPGFTAAIDAFFRRCSLLSLRVLKAISIALKLEEEDFFAQKHLHILEKLDAKTSYSLLRLINYPPVSVEETRVSEVRCGEHSDYGTLTLLFQDEIGGLEVKSRSGEYTQVAPIPGTIIVNIGNILEYMTSGHLLSVKHRVLVKNDNERTRRRRCITFFLHPIHDTQLQPFNSPTVEPNATNAKDFVKKHFEATFPISADV